VPRRMVGCLGVGAGLGLVALLLAVVGGFALGRALDRDRSGRVGEPVPGEESVDVGFARDMGAHHAQAVEMAELLRDRTDDEDFRVLAADIALTQQSQIGQMRGWLDVWGRPPTSVEQPMRWMGHEVPEGQVMVMPGLATDAQLDELASLRGHDAEQLFLQLMIRHHEGGIDMASYAADHAEVSFVRTVAQGMVESQTAEIDQMEQMLDPAPA
jgi:uncharacterized protein (DUF305 family)